MARVLTSIVLRRRHGKVTLLERHIEQGGQIRRRPHLTETMNEGSSMTSFRGSSMTLSSLKWGDAHDEEAMSSIRLGSPMRDHLNERSPILGGSE
eukprot:CAMPEP_0185616290 /NCGR_PEP_ID=MMETSP0436-20130131/39116_1 /TAXON_ID=626734 ORGANISM="Favella taraikaensis, Strain Fe Narragansett Bay" /NCGR_SAMPLE_ID=MMETSP0436 /ASSEMBLY_ACC=CAM_ASM_000390 /LENGTH=94 /DNA_ID=CAMNT_0028252849 /DNA_START=120 /DNA_END=404 /DNA_ORIENTATION=-